MGSGHFVGVAVATKNGLSANKNHGKFLKHGPFGGHQIQPSAGSLFLWTRIHLWFLHKKTTSLRFKEKSGFRSAANDIQWPPKKWPHPFLAPGKRSYMNFWKSKIEEFLVKLGYHSGWEPWRWGVSECFGCVFLWHLIWKSLQISQGICKTSTNLKWKAERRADRVRNTYIWHKPPSPPQQQQQQHTTIVLNNITKTTHPKPLFLDLQSASSFKLHLFPSRNGCIFHALHGLFAAQETHSNGARPLDLVKRKHGEIGTSTLWKWWKWYMKHP